MAFKFLHTNDVLQLGNAPTSKQGLKGVAYMIVSRFSGMILSLLSSSLLGRMLAPADYGLVAMGLSSVILLNLLKDFGLTTAVIQSEDLDAQKIDGVFWVNILISIVLATIGIAASPFIATFYHQPKLVYIIAALCVGLVIVTGFSLHGALLRRRLNFAPLMLSEIAGQFAGLVVGVLIAWKTGSYWAIVLSTLAYNLFSGLVLFIGLPWLPRWPSSFRGLGKLMKFGANLSIFSLLGFFSNQLGAILIGAYTGAVPAGHFNRAQQLLNISGTTLMQPIGQVALPMLSRLQNHAEEYRAYYLSLLEKTAFVFCCLGAFIVVEGDHFTRILLGPKWGDAGLMFRWFGLSVMAIGMVSQNGNVLMSQSRVKALRNWGFCDTIIRAGASVAGLYWGAVGVAAGFSLAALFITVPLVMLLIGSKGPVTFKDQFVCSRPGLLTALIAVTAGLYVRQTYPISNPIISVLYSGGVIAAAAVVVLAIDPKGRKIVSAVLHLVFKRGENAVKNVG